MKTITAATLAAAVALIVGVWSGAALASTPTIQAPHECTVGFRIAEKALIAQENVGVSLHHRATRGQSEFAKHDAEIERLWAELDELSPDYAAAKADCLGDS